MLAHPYHLSQPMQILDSKGLSPSQPELATESFLSIKNVSKVYETPRGPFTVLDGVDLDVQAGEFICLIGHSGCGKTTLLNMVSGFSTPTQGEVRVEGRLITKPGPDRMVVFQNYCLLPWKTAYENVDLAVKAAFPGKSKPERASQVWEHLEWWV